MSKISIEGNASGTGTLTIAAPNTSTNYTLALPEEAGTITTSNSPYSTFRNRIINGDMRIDQRNAGASVTPTVDGTYCLDRMKTRLSQASKFSVQQTPSATETGYATRVAAGFSNYLAVTSAASTSVGAADFFALEHVIEGFNASDLAWGTSDAKTVTLSFWVRSSLTGTFGGSLRNSSNNPSYPFSYTISTANTWEQKSVTITGPTTGTWQSTNSGGIYLSIGLGVGSDKSTTAGSWASGNYWSATGATSVVGTSGATFYITGVQLEVGSVATPFERLDYGRQLIQCQRYCFRFSAGDSYQRYCGGVNGNTTQTFHRIQLPTVMRANPTLTTTGTASNYAIYTGGSVIACSAVPIIDSSSDDVIGPTLQGTVSSGLTQGNYTDLISNNNTTSYLLFSAEL